MADGTLIPTSGPTDNITLTLRVDGQDLSTECRVHSVVVTGAVNRIGQARITIGDGDPAKQDFKWSSAALFLPGKKISILAGYHSKETTLFEGRVVKHAVKSTQRGASTLTVDCRHDAFSMTLVRKNMYYHDMKDSDVFQKMAGVYGLSADVDATAVQHRELIQYGATDWDFLVDRAEMNGLHVLTGTGKLAVKKPDPSAATKLTVLYGETMLEFEAETDARDQIPAVTAKGWDYSQQDLLSQEGADPKIKPPGNLSSSDLSNATGMKDFVLQHPGGRTQEELQAWSDAQLLKSRLAQVRGRVKFTGTEAVQPGDTIELKGVGDRFNGVVLATGVRHEINGGQWTTDVQFGGTPEWFMAHPDVNAPPASGMVPAVRGLQSGIVTQLAGDPDGEDRICVAMPSVDKADQGVWARVSTLDAGKDRGSFFRPEIGDEVLLGFVNDDPRDPVVLGMLNSSALPAPLTTSDDNSEKGFVTRSKIKVIFNDDKKSLTIETPKGKKVQLDDDGGIIAVSDESGNKIEMTSKGITFESAGDTTFKTTGDLKIEGTNIEFKANANFKAEGSAGAELKASGTTVIKGAVVQIN